MLTNSLTAVKERPILFSGAMVRALLAGTKTQTRRLVKPQPDSINEGKPLEGTMITRTPGEADILWAKEIKCPYGQPGDRLWVREAFRYTPNLEAKIKYRADYGETFLSALAETMATWKPSIFMPRAACRILLEITAVRCERLQDISDTDAKAEGVEEWGDTNWWKDYEAEDSLCDDAQASYETLWKSINGPDSWAANPWVWVVKFKRITPDGKEVASA